MEGRDGPPLTFIFLAFLLFSTVRLVLEEMQQVWHMEKQIETSLYRVGDTARLLSVGRSTVYLLLRSGRIDSVKIGRATRITATSITRYLAELQGEPTGSR